VIVRDSPLQRHLALAVGRIGSHACTRQQFHGRQGAACGRHCAAPVQQACQAMPPTRAQQLDQVPHIAKDLLRTKAYGQALENAAGMAAAVVATATDEGLQVGHAANPVDGVSWLPQPRWGRRLQPNAGWCPTPGPPARLEATVHLASA
jgi:hypothetical protein